MAAQRYLHALAPAHVASILAFHSETGCLLLEHLNGDSLASLFERASVERATRIFSLMQVLSSSVKQPPAIPQLEIRCEIFELGLDASAKMADIIDEISGMKLPRVVYHPDLAAANILVNGGKICFIDWDDVFLGLPIVSLARLLADLRRLDPITNWKDIIGRAAISALAPIVTECNALRILELSPILWLAYEISIQRHRMCIVHPADPDSPAGIKNRVIKLTALLERKLLGH